MGTELRNGGGLKQDLYVPREVPSHPQPMTDRHLGWLLPWLVHVQPLSPIGEGVGGCT